jgi:hypothetical protein
MVGMPKQELFTVTLLLASLARWSLARLLALLCGCALRSERGGKALHIFIVTLNIGVSGQVTISYVVGTNHFND